MLIATQSKNVAATRQYFDQVLTQGDYYLGQEVNGQWHGRGSETLGLGMGSSVTKEQFAALLDGKHPVTCHVIAPLLALSYRARNRASVDSSVAMGAIRAIKKPAFAGFLRVGDIEFESTTSTMSTWRSNQLS